MIGKKLKWLPLVNPVFLSCFYHAVSISLLSGAHAASFLFILQKRKAVEHVLFVGKYVYFINPDALTDGAFPHQQEGPVVSLISIPRQASDGNSPVLPLSGYIHHPGY